MPKKYKNRPCRAVAEIGKLSCSNVLYFYSFSRQAPSLSLSLSLQQLVEDVALEKVILTIPLIQYDCNVTSCKFWGRDPYFWRTCVCRGSAMVQLEISYKRSVNSNRSGLAAIRNASIWECSQYPI